MSRPYNKVLQRSDKIRFDIEKLIKRVQGLEEANRRLRENCEGFIQQAEARERVLASCEISSKNELTDN